MTEPVTLGDLRVQIIVPRVVYGVDSPIPGTRPATRSDLVSARRSEGMLVVEKVDGEWPEKWRYVIEGALSDFETRPDDFHGIWRVLLDALAEAQPFPPAGG